MWVLISMTWAAEPALPSATELAAGWGSALPYLNEHSQVPVPRLRPEHLEQLAEGETVGIRQEVVGEIDGAVGLAWLPLAPEAVWLAGLDDVHGHLADDLVEAWLPGTVPGYKVLYQRLDIPSPFRDRHWVCVVQSNVDLYQASQAREQGAIWERFWDLDPRGPEGALEDVPEDLLPTDPSFYLPVNQGGWALIPIGGGVVVLYQVRTDIGGGVPDELAVRFAMASLDTMMRKLEGTARQMEAHYAADHFVILGPDGQEIDRYPGEASKPLE